MTRPSTRRLVLWVGGASGPPLDAHGVLAIRGYRVERIERNALLDAVTGDVAAVCFEVAADVPDVWASAADVARHLLDQGIGVAFAHAEDVDRLTFGSAVANVAGQDPARIRVIYRDWLELARWVAEQLPPEPVGNPKLMITGEVVDDPTARLLLQRAFGDLTGIALRTIEEGKSGAKVWIVTPHPQDRQRRYPPLLAKYNVVAKTRGERSQYELHAHDILSFRLHPPLLQARCVESVTHGLLVFDFVEGAQPFTAVLRSYPPAQLIGALFDHTLAGCRKTATETRGSIVAPFERVSALRWSPALDVAASLAQQHRPDLPDPVRLRSTLSALPPVPHRIGVAHGDLHTGNLLVAAGSSDVLLIDFASVSRGCPLAMDPACLEVSIAFAPTDAASAMGRVMPPGADAEWLRRAYRYPLDPSAVPDRLAGHVWAADAWVADALRAVRAEARKVEPSPLPYAVAVASYLIRYASHDDHASCACRALAYEFACDLVLNVFRVLTSQSSEPPVPRSATTFHATATAEFGDVVHLSAPESGHAP